MRNPLCSGERWSNLDRFAHGGINPFSVFVDEVDETVDRLERFGLQFGIAFQHADDVLDDDQPALRQKALARTESLVAQCLDLVAPLGDAAEPLRGIANWVGDRAKRAHAGEIED